MIGTRASSSSQSCAASSASSVPSRISATIERGSGGIGRNAQRPGAGEVSATDGAYGPGRWTVKRGLARVALAPPVARPRQCLRPPTIHRRTPRPGDTLEPFLLSFAVIFVAELGDKSQLMALTFATRFRALPS